MKMIRKLLLVGLLCLSFSVFANDPNPPPPPGEHGLSGDQPVGAPIDGGLGILLLLGVGYGIKKLYKNKK